MTRLPKNIWSKITTDPTAWIYILAAVTCVIAGFLIRSLVTELTTQNYGFYGNHFDFLAFFTAGKTVLNHTISNLYNASNITALQRLVIPHPVGAAGYMPYLNPPFLAVFLAPLALLNINTARLLWLMVSVVLSVFILYKLTDGLSKNKRLFASALLLFTYPLFQTFIEGQVSIVVLLGGTLAYTNFKRRKKVLSGAWLATLWLLPQFGVFALIGLLVKREWRMIKGWAISTFVLLLITLPLTGIGIYITYIKFLAQTTSHHFINMNTAAHLDWRGALSMTSGLNGFYESILGQNHTAAVNVLYIVTSLLLIGLLLYAVKKIGNTWTVNKEAMMFLAALCTACLIDPHLYAQDAVVILLALPALLILYKQYAIKAVILLGVICNLILLDQYSRVHCTTLLLVFGALSYTYLSLRKPAK